MFALCWENFTCTKGENAVKMVCAPKLSRRSRCIHFAHAVPFHLDGVPRLSVVKKPWLKRIFGDESARLPPPPETSSASQFWINSVYFTSISFELISVVIGIDPDGILWQMCAFHFREPSVSWYSRQLQSGSLQQGPGGMVMWEGGWFPFPVFLTHAAHKSMLTACIRINKCSNVYLWSACAPIFLWERRGRFSIRGRLNVPLHLLPLVIMWSVGAFGCV